MITEEDVMRLAEFFSDRPFIILLSVFLMTFVLEDVATVSAALISGAGYIEPPYAVLALCCGIILGDMALYGLGAAAREFHWAQSLLQKGGVRRAQNWLAEREVAAIIGARFVPGARLPTYSSMGFFKLSFRKFVITIFFASILWTLLLFTAVLTIGESAMVVLDQWRWVVAIIMILIVALMPLIIQIFSRRIK